MLFCVLIEHCSTFGVVLLNKTNTPMSTIEFNQQLLSLRQQLYYFALSLTRDRDNAQDLLQESILRALSNRDKFADNTNFKAWICTIMRNTFINDHRRGKRTSAIMDRVERAQEQVRRVETPATTEASLKMREINNSLDRLEDTFRQPFQMHHAGYKYHEIADHLSIPIGTVKSRIHQARQRLMYMLSDKHIQ